MAAATGIASEAGVGALSVRAVAARAGCGIGTLRHYFPIQQELVDAVLPRVLDQQLHDDGIDDHTRPRAERLGALMSQFLPPDDGTDDAKQLAMWFELLASALGTGAASGMTRMLEVMAAQGRQRVTQWLRQLAPEHADDPEWLADTTDFLTSLCGGLCLEALMPGSPVTLARARRILARATENLFTVEGNARS